MVTKRKRAFISRLLVLQLLVWAHRFWQTPLKGVIHRLQQEQEERGSKTEKTQICVYHCQNRYSVCHPHEGKLCQFITHSEKPGHYSQLFREGRKSYSEIRRTYSTQTVHKSVWYVAGNERLCLMDVLNQWQNSKVVGTVWCKLRSS